MQYKYQLSKYYLQKVVSLKKEKAHEKNLPKGQSKLKQEAEKTKPPKKKTSSKQQPKGKAKLAKPLNQPQKHGISPLSTYSSYNSPYYSKTRMKMQKSQLSWLLATTKAKNQYMKSSKANKTHYISWQRLYKK